MSDNRKRYRAIHMKLMQLHNYPAGRVAQRIAVLAGYISGIVGSRKTHNREVAKQSGLRATVESRIKRIGRWYQNEGVGYEVEYLPYVRPLLEELAHYPLALAMDATGVGRNCMALMVHVIYERRAIPIGWTVIGQPKGHSPAEVHIQLLEQVRAILPDTCEVVFLGDGEFDSVELQTYLRDLPNWDYVSRTAKSTQLEVEGEITSYAEQGAYLEPGICLSLPDVLFSQQAFGPVHAVFHWGKQYEEPLYLVTSFELAKEACHWYSLRMRIETFFSDQKSRGFGLDKSHISEPARLSRLLIAACLAYIWIIYLGVQSHVRDMVPILHRADRCDLSLFQLGLDYLHYFIEEELDIEVSFSLPTLFLYQKCVR